MQQADGQGAAPALQRPRQLLIRSRVRGHSSSLAAGGCRAQRGAQSLHVLLEPAHQGLRMRLAIVRGAGGAPLRLRTARHVRCAPAG